jgi:hypothetical protein
VNRTSDQQQHSTHNGQRTTHRLLSLYYFVSLSVMSSSVIIIPPIAVSYGPDITSLICHDSARLCFVCRAHAVPYVLRTYRHTRTVYRLQSTDRDERAERQSHCLSVSHCDSQLTPGAGPKRCNNISTRSRTHLSAADGPLLLHLKTCCVLKTVNSTDSDFGTGAGRPEPWRRAVEAASSLASSPRRAHVEPTSRL